MEIRGFSKETHDRTRKWAHDTVLDEHSSCKRAPCKGLQSWALLWGLMFALLRPLPQRTALTLWRPWNNLKLVSRHIADIPLLCLVFKSKTQEVDGSIMLILGMQNFSSVFSAFSTGATWGCCRPWVLFMYYKCLSKVILCPCKKDWCIQCLIQ